MTPILKVSDYLIAHANALALEIVEGVIQGMELKIPETEKNQAITMYIGFMVFLGESIGRNEEKIPLFLIEWSKKNAISQVIPQGKISEIVVRYPPTRVIFTDVITRISLECGVTLQEHAFVIKRMNAMLDLSLNETVCGFERLSEQYKEETQRELAHLSAPIVPVKEGIVILPLIGDIDHFKAKHIMEQVVPKIAEMRVNYVIVNFTAILTIDKEIALYLHQIGHMINLIGIQVIATGIGPDIAKTAVKAGISLANIPTFANVQKALEYIE
ncbi:STAS domain-containing protein [Bacillus solitudinis]|uniref:STAS domain-containing protein n=1 Tax=Bacillus solitudinis TaxID=2014074 RepID=UPI000C234C4F|nr:STAS domain-containing protein [Bacillus solitudinis]